ncbi:MAG: tetratricopeptide repeat protein [Bacteroidales bacterium]|jgi:tetratricopeptide (TPR) repeat protein|nr:tetratricopeptide repeat protein [Bacteroidales bacterium]
MTARYNIYFNGYENFKEGVAKVSENHTDDFAEILPVFDYSAPSTPSYCSSDMERAIQKASKLISLKSITARPNNIDSRNDISEKDREMLERKEYNDWVDDSYLLIAKARFYKHEFESAKSILEYSITSANEQTVKDEASLWLARLYNETGNYNESSRILHDMKFEPESKGLLAMYHTTLADLFVKQKRYGEAIAPLVKAIENVSGKKTRYRLMFLLAQIYDQTGDGAQATVYYRKVIKMRPPYEVEFYAKVKQANILDVNAANTVEVRRQLERMLRDSKNNDFQDQIYYALGNLSMKEGDIEEAIRFFRLSASAPSMNQNQKGRSYLALASYFYSKPDYMEAATFYDSSMYFLNETYPDYLSIKTTSQSLNVLVENLKTVQAEDSLQKVAAMTEQQRTALISQIIAGVVKAESEGAASGTSDRYNMGQFYENERRFQGQISQEGSWYFYNQSALTFGRTEFRRRWGDRRLQDNWRRANKSVIADIQDEPEDEAGGMAGDTTEVKVLDNKQPDYYLQNLPMNDSLLAISNNRIAGALLNAGKAYAEMLNNPAKATETLEQIKRRFPSSELVPEALYNLYNINKEINGVRSETYRQELLTAYPESEFAKILADPDYFAKKLAELKAVETLYEKAYTQYSAEDFASSIATVNEALGKFAGDALAPKFMLLKAYCVAKTGDERRFKEELNRLIRQFPESAEAIKASEISAFLNQTVPELKVEEDRQTAREIYSADKSANHYFAVVIDNPAFNMNQATFDIISYNIDNYTNSNYRTEGDMVVGKFTIITVSGFRDFREALGYYTAFSAEKSIRNPEGNKIHTFLISRANLNILKSDGNIGSYDIFFRENILE